MASEPDSWNPETAWRTTHDDADAHHYRVRGWWRDRSHLDDFLDVSRLYPEKDAIIAYEAGQAEPTRLTYGELRRLVDRCAVALVATGIGVGDFVSIQLPNGWQFPVAALAVMRAGAIPNPIPPIYREKEVEFMVRHARSRMLITPTDFAGFEHVRMATAIKDRVPTLDHIFAVGSRGAKGVFEERIIDVEWEKDGEAIAELDRRRPAADSAAVLLFTSGTTGHPKAAIHSFNTIWSAGRPIPDALDLSRDDVVFMASTMGHLTGFYWGMLMPLSMGQTVVYQDAWRPAAMLEAIASDGITWTLSATPFALDLVAAHRAAEGAVDVSSLRAFVCGGAPIPPHVATQVHEALGTELISLWGCTEVGICSIHRRGTSVEALARSDGYRVDQMAVRIADDDDKVVERGEAGRLQVKGAGIFAGYLRQPELTEALKTPDGWFDTGDLGREAEDGAISICGRSKDIIIRGGQNVPVVEIENELALMPQIADVVVVGVPDERLGERGCAVVVPSDPARPPVLADITAWLDKAGTAKQFWPERIEIVEAMPRTPAGKIKKFELRDRFARRGASDAALQGDGMNDW